MSGTSSKTREIKERCNLRPFTVWLLLLFGASGSAQSLSEQWILSDRPDSVYRKEGVGSFNKEGNYCFTIHVKGEDFFYLDHDTINPHSDIGAMFSGHGDIATTYGYSKTNKRWYYKNYRGTKVYGPLSGEMARYSDNDTHENIAITQIRKDTVEYYANGRLIHKTNMAKEDRYTIESDDWCAFSENGNMIYAIKNGPVYTLYVNGKVVDTSYFKYTQLKINDKGHYVFAEGRRPKVKTNGYDYMFFTHSAKASLGPVRTVWNCDLNDDGGYYYSGDDNGPTYLVINDTLYKNLRSVSDITLAGNRHYLFTHEKNGKKLLCVNGKDCELPYSKIYGLVLDRQGNFACFGLRDYYLYRFVNGHEDASPVTRFNVRPTPVYISPKGEALVYYTTDDSVYVYQNNRLILPALNSSVTVSVSDYTKVLPVPLNRQRAASDKSLLYFQVDTVGYFVYNGQLSRPMIPFAESTLRHNTFGEIVAGGLTDKGFYSIQRTGSQKFTININNRVYRELDGVDDIFQRSCFFDGNELVFYGTKALAYYRFVLKL